MGFSYGGDPSDNEKDAVRFLVGDTTEDEAFLQDEEILFLMHIWEKAGSIYYIASTAADAIAAKLAREVSVNADGQNLSTSELQQKFQLLSEMLRAQHKELLAGGEIHAGGMLASEQPDLTVAGLAFGTGMHDHREGGQQDYGDRGGYREWGYGQWGEYTP